MPCDPTFNDRPSPLSEEPVMPVTIGGSGPITGVTSINTSVSDTELGYLDGVTSAIQTQINTAGGLVKIADSTFSAQSSVSINSCFTSTYTNYRIILNISAASTNTSFSMRLRASGSDASGANYYRAIWYRAVGGSFGSTDTNGGTTWVFGDINATYPAYCGLSMDVLTPALARQTVGLAMVQTVDATPAIFGASGTYLHNLASAYDGLTIYPNAGTFSGTLRVYGMKD